MDIKRRNTVVALDIGTSTIKAALAEVFYGQDLNVLGLARVASAGVRKGQIVDIESTARAINECLNELERLTGVEVLSTLLGFSGVSVAAINNHAMVAVGNPNYEIEAEDKERVLHSARSVALPPDKTILQTIEREYIVDGFDGVKDPVGMVGSRLEAEVTIIIAAAAGVQNLQRSANRINLHISQIVYNPILVGEAVLSPAEKDMGVLLLDIGGGTTEISLFQDGSILHTAVLPIGDEYITKDLAIILRTSLEEAARIKEKYGVASMDMAKDEVMINVKNMQGKDSQQVSQKVVAEIISARVNEMMEIIYSEMSQFTSWDRVPGGMVISGGGAELAGICGVIEEYFNMPVRIGVPDNLHGIGADFNSPQNAAVLGGLVFAALHTGVRHQAKEKGVSGLRNSISDWIKDLFR